MPSKTKQSSERKYRKIVLEERQELIDMVIGKGMKIIEAARKLKINPSTVRIIVQNYKEEGIIYEKRSERLERKQRDTQSLGIT